MDGTADVRGGGGGMRNSRDAADDGGAGLKFRDVLCASFSLMLALIAGAVASSQALADGRHGRPRALDGSASQNRVWPVEGGAGAARPQVARGWEPPPTPWTAGHRGVDLTARQGRPVRAVADGRVSFSGSVAGRGVLSIELSGTGDPPIRTTYEPVRPSVRKGKKVRAGETVATVTGGPTHCRERCLHWGARRGGHYLDPLSLLPAALLHGGPSRLLPVFGIPVPRSNAPRHPGKAAGAPSAQADNTHRTRAATQVGTVNTAAVTGQFGMGGVAWALALTTGALFACRRLAGSMLATPPRAPPRTTAVRNAVSYGRRAMPWRRPPR
jgi:hypothetical protein